MKKDTQFEHIVNKRSCGATAYSLRKKNLKAKKQGKPYRYGPSLAVQEMCVGKEKGLNMRKLRKRSDGANLVLWPRTNKRHRVEGIDRNYYKKFRTYEERMKKARKKNVEIYKQLWAEHRQKK